jgi:hypothetical protein
MKPLSSERIAVDGYLQAMEHFWAQGWTDGLPVVPPTEDLVRECLAQVRLEPDEIVGEYRIRDRAITAEKLAINAVMAGCRPEYMPILVAACQAVTQPAFHLNHIASLASPWPLLIINGPQVKTLGFNSGVYVFGPGTRANATVGRALSLTLANCMEARLGGIQRGAMGHAARWGFCIAENEDTSWAPLHLERGFDRDANVVTAYPSGDCPTQVFGPAYEFAAEQWAEMLAMKLARTRFFFAIGAYVLVVSPGVQEVFAKAGWSKADLRRYIMDNCWETAADLKRMGHWWYDGSPTGKAPVVKPGDDQRRVYLFKREAWYENDVWYDAGREREPDILIVVAGGDASPSAALIGPYDLATNPVSQEVKAPR